MREIGLVIPSYNAHDTIKKLLHSICLFTFLPIVDILIVDDFSDEPYDYLKEIFPELKLEIIRFEKNYGPGYARNLGINWAIEKKLPYLMFADADDFFLNCNFWVTITDEQKEKNDLFIFNFFDEEHESNIKDLDVWCFAKIYKTEIIKKNKIYFSENYSNEDVIFNFLYLGVTETAYVDNRAIYYWHKRENSLSRTGDYMYDSIYELVCNLIDNFLKYQNIFSEQRKISMITNRMIRLYYHVNELLMTHPKMLEGDEKDIKLCDAFKNFYDKCYAPFESQITIQQIFQEFEEINQGNDILHHFIWIDYFRFLDIIKNKKEEV